MKKINLILIIGIVLVLTLPFINAAVLTTEQIQALNNSIVLLNYFNGTCGNDESRNNNDGVTTGVEYTATGSPFGSSCRGSGTTDRVAFTSTAQMQTMNNFTALAWINTTSQALGAISSTRTANGDGTWEFFITDVGTTIRSTHYTGSTQASATYKFTSEWNQVAYIQNGSGNKGQAIAINGTIAASASIGADAVTTTANLNLFQSPQSVTNGWNERMIGGMDNFILFNRSLTTDELNYTHWSFLTYGRFNVNVSVVAANTCTYSGSGDWGILASDNCVISVVNNLGKNNIYCYGSGTLEATATQTFYNFNQVAIHAGCRFNCATGVNCFG